MGLNIIIRRDKHSNLFMIPYLLILISVLFSYIEVFNIPFIYLSVIIFSAFCLFTFLFFPLKKDIVVILWLIFFVTSLISFFYVQNMEHAITGLRVYLTMFIAYSIHLFFPLRKKHIYIIMGIYITILAYFVLLSYYNFLQNPDLLNHRAFVGTGWMRSNALASMWATSVPISIALFIKSNKFILKLYFALISLLLAFGIILTTSRGGLIALSLGLVIFLIYYIYQKKDNLKRIGIIYIVVILFIVIIPFLLQNSLFLNLADRTSTALSGDSNGRFFLWESALDAWSKNILFGNGFYNLNEFAHTVEEVRAHNFILNMLADTGLIGTILYLSILIALMKSIFNNKEIFNDVILTSVFISLIVTIIHGLIEPTLTVLVLGVLFWIKAGMLRSLT